MKTWIWNYNIQLLMLDDYLRICTELSQVTHRINAVNTRLKAIGRDSMEIDQVAIAWKAMFSEPSDEENLERATSR